MTGHSSVRPEQIRLSGELPDGLRFAAVVGRESIAVNADGRVCAAHPRWMTTAEATDLAAALMEVSRG